MNNYSRGNAFATIKNFRTENLLLKIFLWITIFKEIICNDTNVSTKEFLVDNYSRGNNFAVIKNFRPKNFEWKFLVDNYSWGNYFIMIKNFQTKNCWWKFVVDNNFWGNDFAMIKNFRPKQFDENFQLINILSKMILQ